MSVSDYDDQIRLLEFRVAMLRAGRHGVIPMSGWPKWPHTRDVCVDCGLEWHEALRALKHLRGESE